MTTNLASGYSDLLRYLRTMNLMVTGVLSAEDRIRFQKDTLSSALL